MYCVGVSRRNQTPNRTNPRPPPAPQQAAPFILQLHAGMGVEKLTELVERQKVFLDVLDGLRGKTIAWDVSVDIYRALACLAAGHEYYSRPLVPVVSVKERLSKVLEFFGHFDITLVAVFDGVQHPVKGREGRERTAAAAALMTNIESLWQRANPEELKDLHKLKKRAGRVRPDVIFEAVKFLRSQKVECVGAPFEAEWQCVHMEKVGLAQGVLSVDSDTVPLGGHLIVQKFGWNMIEGERTRVASILRRNEFMQRLALRLTWPDINDEGLRALCCFMGCDYILKIHGNGIGQCASAAKHFQALLPCQSK